MRRLTAVPVVLIMFTSCGERSVTQTELDSAPAASLALEAVMRFGDPRAGSPFPPGSQHDMSLHAADKVVPRTVVIAAGGTVTFDVAPVHRVAIYDAGTQPGDILRDPALTFEPAPVLGIPNFQINAPTNRLALQSAAAFLAPRTFTYTFTAPGRYLIICVTTPHFVVGDMYAWVIVQ